MHQKTRFKAAPLEILEEDPFKDDLLGRKQSAEILTEFVGSLHEPFVLSIDSPFGTGKTTFIKMWCQHLQNEGYPCLCFNAWENDFSDAPLVSLIGELGAGIEALQLTKNEKKLASKIFQKTKRAGAALVKSALPTAIKIATSGFLDLSAATEADISKLMEDIAKKQIDKYQSDKKTISRFRDDLTKLVQALAQKQRQGSSKPLVFIIDELDRCRPPYAIELLEKIKHLFSVGGLVFVLAIDRQQLAESVKALYGSGMDASGYLKRFIDLEYVLPEPDYPKFVEAQFLRFRLQDLFEAKIGETRSDRKHLADSLTKLFGLFKLSLRVQEQCFTQISIILRTTPPGEYLFGFHLALLLCLRVSNRSLYLDYCAGHASPAEVLTYLRSLTGGRDLINSRFGTLLEAHLVTGIRNEKEREAAVAAVLDLARAAAGDKRAISRAQEMANVFQGIGGSGSNMTVYVQKKIEMAHRFIEPGLNV